MNSIVARLLLSSTVFLLPLIVAAQTDESDDSVTLTALDPLTGEALPTQDGKASIVGTPGDGVPDGFSYAIGIRTLSDMESADLDGAILELKVLNLTEGTAEREEYGRVEHRDLARAEIGDDYVNITGVIDLSSDTELGQMLEYLGSLDFPDGRRATFKHDVTVGCICPRAGSWTATNYPGTMVCTGPHFNRTLPLPGSTQTATLLVDYGCQAMDITNFDDEYAEVTMQRVPGECGYEGYARDVPMESRFTFDVQNEEFLIGKLRMQIEQQGTTCIISRDFEVRFND